jgi:hypothetical protein
MAIALCRDWVFEYNLWGGQVGTVVEILANGSAVEVEFSDPRKRDLFNFGVAAAPVLQS